MRKFAILAAGAALAAAVPAFAQTMPADAAADTTQTAPATATPDAAAPAAATSAAPAATAAPKAVAVGQTVLDTAGGEVGKVTKVENGNAVVATGSHDVAMPLTSFALSDKGPVIAMTRVQLDAAAVEAKAKTASAAPAGSAKP